MCVAVSHDYSLAVQIGFFFKTKKRTKRVQTYSGMYKYKVLAQFNKPVYCSAPVLIDCATQDWYR